MRAGEFSIDHGEDYAVVTFGEGFDMLSSAPGGGYSEGIGCISVGREIEGAFCIMPGTEGAKVSVHTGNYGQTAVAVIAVSDLRSGIGRATEGCPETAGTHVLVIMDTDMPVSAMARATMTATEAVTVVIQDLVLACDDTPSLGSGSAVQSVTAVRNTVSDIYLHGAGKHSKLGELIGVCTRDAVRESAERNGMTPELTGSVKRRLDRFGHGSEFSMPCSVENDPAILSAVSACLFISDECRWGLVPEKEAREVLNDFTEVVFSGEGLENNRELMSNVCDVIHKSLP